jgi:hypothetical protein
MEHLDVLFFSVRCPNACLASLNAHAHKVTRFFRGNPRLLLHGLPVAVGMVLLKWLYDESPLKHLDLSPLLTAIIAAEVFIIGFLLSGTADDFKEAERLPGEVSASLESIADECLIIDAELKLPELVSAFHCWQRSAAPSTCGCWRTRDSTRPGGDFQSVADLLDVHGRRFSRAFQWSRVESRLRIFRLTVIKGDIDALESFGPLSLCLPGIGLAVTSGQIDVVSKGSQQGTRVEAIGRHHVGFGA